MLRGKDLIRAISTTTTVTVEPALPQHTPRQRVAAYLASVAPRYIRDMREYVGEIFFGDDIDMIKIAQFLNIKIYVSIFFRQIFPAWIYGNIKEVSISISR